MDATNSQLFRTRPNWYNGTVSEIADPTVTGIAEALRALPVLPEYEQEVPITQARLETFTATVKGFKRKMADPEVSDLRAARELRRISAAARTLKDSCDSISVTAFRAWREHNEKGGKGRGLTGEILRDIGRAADEMESAAAVLEHRGRPGPPGRPPKHLAQFFADQAALEAHRLTGRHVTITTDPITGKAHGPYLQLVHALFAAAGIDASAENFARDFIKEMRAKEKTPLSAVD